MGKLIQWNVLSLDGYFEGKRSWDVEWFHSYFESEQREFSLKQLRSAAGLVFGRVTYGGMAAYWRTATIISALRHLAAPTHFFEFSYEFFLIDIRQSFSHTISGGIPNTIVA